ncbi:MAG: acylneuraminate cytidylyltransferase, partial [Nanoarchaeota archaeon]|nr:acylneuraminate cytidylyltransferase [Nanoarchaeota archaeon]
TSINSENDEIEELCKMENYNLFRGSENDVLKRFYETAKKFGLNTTIRICADDPLIDPETINKVLEEFGKGDFDYLSNVKLRSYPRGLDVEVFSFEALEKAHFIAKEIPEREHVTMFIYGNPKMFKVEGIIAEGIFRRPEFRLCVDTKEDFKLMKILYNKFYKNDEIVNIRKVIEFLDENLEISKLNLVSEEEQRMRNLREGVKQNVVGEKD